MKGFGWPPASVGRVQQTLEREGLEILPFHLGMVDNSRWSGSWLTVTMPVCG